MTVDVIVGYGASDGYRDVVVPELFDLDDPIAASYFALHAAVLATGESLARIGNVQRLLDIASDLAESGSVST